MKTKILLIICLIFLSVFQIKAQIENEIKSYVDSAEIMINNGRKLLAEELRLYNYAKAKDIYSFLNRKVEDIRCEAFTYNEHLLISLLTSDFGNFLNKAANFKTGNRLLCYQTTRNMERELYEEAARNNDLIQKHIQDANLSEEDAELIALYLLLFNPAKSETLYQAKIKSFQKSYPHTPYNDFVKTYLPSPDIPASMAFSMGPTAFFPQGNLKNMYNSTVGFGLDWDICINKVYASLFIETGNLRLKIPFDAVSVDGEKYNFRNNDKFTYFQGGAKGGYYALRTNRLHLAPYAALGASSLVSDIYKKQIDEDKELKIFNSFFAGAGIHAEVKLYEYKAANNSHNNYYGNMPGYISLKFDAGYNFITNQKFEQLKGNMLYAALTLSWGIGKF